MFISFLILNFLRVLEGIQNDPPIYLSFRLQTSMKMSANAPSAAARNPGTAGTMLPKHQSLTFGYTHGGQPLLPLQRATLISAWSDTKYGVKEMLAVQVAGHPIQEISL